MVKEIVLLNAMVVKCCFLGWKCGVPLPCNALNEIENENLGVKSVTSYSITLLGTCAQSKEVLEQRVQRYITQVKNTCPQMTKTCIKCLMQGTKNQ